VREFRPGTRSGELMPCRGKKNVGRKQKTEIVQPKNERAESTAAPVKPERAGGEGGISDLGHQSAGKIGNGNYCKKGEKLHYDREGYATRKIGVKKKKE